jgi:hypothetical protein
MKIKKVFAAVVIIIIALVTILSLSGLNFIIPN